MGKLEMLKCRVGVEPQQFVCGSTRASNRSFNPPRHLKWQILFVLFFSIISSPPGDIFFFSVFVSRLLPSAEVLLPSFPESSDRNFICWNHRLIGTQITRRKTDIIVYMFGGSHV